MADGFRSVLLGIAHYAGDEEDAQRMAEVASNALREAAADLGQCEACLGTGNYATKGDCAYCEGTGALSRNLGDGT